MPYEIKHIIHSQKKVPKSRHDAILMEALEKGINTLLHACVLPLKETVTVRCVMDGKLQRVLCVTNDDRSFALLNNPEYRDAKHSHYSRFFEEEKEFYRIIDLNHPEEDYPLMQEFLDLGYRTNVLMKIDHAGVVSVHSEMDISNPKNRETVQSLVHDFRESVYQSIKDMWDVEVLALYEKMDILTSLAKRDEETAFQKIMEFIALHHTIFRCAIFIIDNASESYELLAGYPKGAHGTSSGWLAEHPLLRDIVSSGKDLHITDLDSDPRTQWLTRRNGVMQKYGVTEIAAFPIYQQEAVKAVMTVDYAGTNFQFNPLVDRSFFQSVCAVISNILSVVSHIKVIRLDEDICRIVDHFLHEIRNPVTASAGFARRSDALLKKLEGAPEDSAQSLERFQRNTKIIVKESNRIEEILNDFETFVGLKHERVKISRELVSLSDVSVYLKTLFHGLKVAISPAAACLDFHTEPSRLHQILFNLLKNAYEHTYEMDYKEILLRSRDFFDRDVFLNIDAKHEWIVFEVLNKGSIPENLMDRVFEPYFTCGFHDGSGLGLPICAELAKLMHGEITFENMELNGEIHVAFRLALPLQAETPKLMAS